MILLMILCLLVADVILVIAVTLVGRGLDVAVVGFNVVLKRTHLSTEVPSIHRSLHKTAIERFQTSKKCSDQSLGKLYLFPSFDDNNTRTGKVDYR